MIKLQYILISLTYLISCNSFALEKTQLDIGNVKNVSVYMHKNEDNPVYLSNYEINEFISEWNNSETIGLCKYAVKIWLIVENHNSKKREFRINAENIKENNDICYKISTNLSSLLYDKAK